MAPWARPPTRDLVGVPALNLGAQPEFRASAAEVNNRTRHVCVLALVLADGVAVGEAEDASDLVGIDEIVDIYPLTHSDHHTRVSGATLHLVVVLSDRRATLLV